MEVNLVSSSDNESHTITP